MGKPAYFFTVSPTMDVSFIYRLDATSSTDLNVEAKTMIVASDKEGYGEEQNGEGQKKYSGRRVIRLAIQKVLI